MEDPQQLALELYPNPDPQTGEIWVRTPREHGRLVHGGGMGCVAIAQKIPKSGFWREKSHPVEVAIELLRHYVGQEDVYLSTRRFKSRRRIAHLLSLGSLHMDLDYYRISELARVHPLQVLEMALLALEKAGMPKPTLAPQVRRRKDPNRFLRRNERGDGPGCAGRGPLRRRAGPLGAHHRY